ncbi:chemotaxis protein CheB [Mucilaginibacter sp. PAMB04274]|uniref:chemotaxis protein CheB n=1 Tax=Mucilaginibacter sp. PAMB04274 TaxID=3138568 RepID=UPI0031F63D5E
MAEVTHPIIVIGSSAGGWEALPIVLENFPEYLAASVFVVQHFPSDTMGTAFLNHLSAHSVLPCAFAVDNEPIRPSRVYVAPPDFHLLLTKDRVRITKGPRENSFRPAIDTMFRSAAAHHHSGVIGVILTGVRDDGVEGMAAIARSGGITMVQDPANAPYPDMPQAAIKHIDVNYITRTVEMGLVLSGLIYQPAKSKEAISEDILKEAAIAERVLTSLDIVEQGAKGTGFTCPMCGGVLWDIDHGITHSYRCAAGHAFTWENLCQLKATEVEEAMWTSLRLMEEQKRMLLKFPLLPRESNSIQRRVKELEQYVQTLRAMLLKSGDGRLPEEHDV